MQKRWNSVTMDSYRITLRASDAVLMPNELFRYTIAPVGVSPVDGTQLPIGAQAWGGPGVGVFDGVCTPPDLDEFPINEPALGGIPPYYRSAVLDLLFRSYETAQETFAAIETGIARLIRALNDHDGIGEVQPIWIDRTPPSNPFNL